MNKFAGIVLFFNHKGGFGMVADISGRSRRFYESSLDGLTFDDVKAGALVDFTVSNFTTVQKISPFTQSADSADAVRLREVMDESVWRQAQVELKHSGIIKYKYEDRSN